MMEDGRCRVEEKRWRMEDGAWKKEDWTCKLEDGRWIRPESSPFIFFYGRK